jgi:4-carboxymuconolactone decarboxylase
MRVATTLLVLLLLPASGGRVAFAQDAGRITVSRAGSRPVTQAPAANFTGVGRVEMLSVANDATRASAGTVAFEPGARTAWHTHPRGQTLIVTAGTGRVQRWGGPVDEIRPGDVVWIPPGVKHWHGAAPTTAMTHIAITEHLNGGTVAWLEQVSDAQYGARVESAGSATRPSAPASERASLERLREAYGGFAPKMVELTENVLFADVWARPQLARRDRSLVTVSALAALNRPDQLRSHIALARENGVTQEEMVEAITHLAFYTGWPSALTALGVAKDIYQQR